MSNTPDDTLLIKGIEAGKESAFEELFLKYYTPLVVFARKVIPDEDQARELVQDVFVSFYEKRKELNIHSSLKAHLYQSVKNRCLNQVKRNQIRRDHHANIFIEKKNDEAFIEDKLQETELESRIFSIVQTLPDQCRKIFEMSRFKGLTNQEIADKLELSKRTVETQVSKALKVMRKHLSDYLTVIIWLSALLLQLKK